MKSLLENQDPMPGRAELRIGDTYGGEASSFPLVYELSPVPNPADCFRRLTALPHLLFLDSALEREHLGRFSYLAADPFRFLEVRDGRFWVDGKSQEIPAGTTPLDLLSREMAEFASPRQAGLPAFQGGAAGVFGYDLCRYFERLPVPPADDFQVPDLSIGLYDWVIAWDHRRQQAWIISTGFPELEAAHRKRRAANRLARVLQWLNEPGASRAETVPASRASVRPGWTVPGLKGLESNFDPKSYAEVIRQAIEYIHAGDCFQVNIAQRLRAPFADDAVDLYVRLRERNAATFGGFFDQGDFVLASASPERFLQVDRGLVRTRPIKGTRPRSVDSFLDAPTKSCLGRQPQGPGRKRHDCRFAAERPGSSM